MQRSTLRKLWLWFRIAVVASLVLAPICFFVTDLRELNDVRAELEDPNSEVNRVIADYRSCVGYETFEDLPCSLVRADEYLDYDIGEQLDRAEANELYNQVTNAYNEARLRQELLEEKEQNLSGSINMWIGVLLIYSVIAFILLVLGVCWIYVKIDAYVKAD